MCAQDDLNETLLPVPPVRRKAARQGQNAGEKEGQDWRSDSGDKFPRYNAEAESETVRLFEQLKILVWVA
jgi:hypothetical protein